ncbi:cholesterol oxidase substrate-binding domain-containing protein [Streptomyces acidiscabies]|uniref:cholesterol oxidase substrate-binding domain-containing protein n=1 Tax=Streptomyces acidiscabies TaxID=42234 RepID=UPI000952562E|nr:cholesterol oxidase substrate-binding domain-containing protein [Streptomyces acidiscabies]
MTDRLVNLPSRRGFLGGAAAVLVLLAADPAAASSELPGFPSEVDLRRTAYRNWDGTIVAVGLWACVPETPAQAVAAVNWAHAQGWTVRARGASHGWAPLTLAEDTPADAKILLLDTSRFTGLALDSPTSVRAGTGVRMETLLGFLEDHGLGVTAAPAPGDLTLGGVLAIDGHGTAVPARGESRSPGQTYGSLSNRVLSLTAVVWDGQAYALRTFSRDEADCAALLTHLGRVLVVEAVLRVEANSNLRCVSRTDIPAKELFGESGRTFAGFVDSAGRVEAIWFPFTEFPWLKTWSVEPVKPLLSRRVNSPYNYPFSDNLPTLVADLAGRLVADAAWYLAPVLGNAQLDAAVLGLTATLSADLWGPSKNTLLYVRPTTLRVHANGYAILTSRDRIQRVVREFADFYRKQLDAYAAQGKFPVNGAVEIRVTGLDVPADAEHAGARAPLVSALSPAPGRPEWDTAVWLDILTLPGTPHAEEFYRELERFLLDSFDGTDALARVEWSKGWAYTDTAAWADPEVLGTAVPASYGAAWGEAAGTLQRLDPHGVFRAPLHQRLFP